MMIALAFHYDLQLHQLDITIAFLNGDPHENVYMRQPEGFEIKGQEHLVCNLSSSVACVVLNSHQDAGMQLWMLDSKKWAFNKQTVIPASTKPQKEKCSLLQYMSMTKYLQEE